MATIKEPQAAVNAIPREETPALIHRCTQRHKDMGNEWILGPVCGKCCRTNHKRVTGKR